MAYTTEVTYTQSGNANKDFTITFPFLDSDHIKVQLDGVSKTADTDFTVSGLTVTFVSGILTSGTNIVRIWRDTDIDDLSIIFQTGASVRAQDLNDISLQLLYGLQETNTLYSAPGSPGSGVVLTLGDKNHITVNSATDWTINNNVVSNAMMLDNSIGSSELINLSVINSKVAENAISKWNMQDNSVHTAELQNDAVTTEKIDPYAVTYNRMQHMSNDLTVLGRWDAYTGQNANHVPAEIKISNGHLSNGFDFASHGTPVGSVIWYAGSLAPSGYLKANGDAIANGSGTTQGVTADFSALYAVVGANLPDLRGEFVRGFDDGKGTDSGRGIRTTQAEATNADSHTHYTLTGQDSNAGFGNDSGVSGSLESAMASASCNPQNAFSDYQIGGEDYSSYPPTLGKTSGASGGGTETRPRNVALLACIKY